MLTVGLTGGIGSGKTTVSNLFEGFGIPVIDTDVISRDLVNNDSSVLELITETFGNSVILRDGCLDRKQLAQIVFNNEKARQKLEDILHPKIRSVVKGQLQKLRSEDNPPPYVIIVIPLLFETGFRDLIDRILVITADEDGRIERIVNRDHRNMDEIRSIIDSQVTDETRINEADDVIENNHSFDELEAQIRQLHVMYTGSPSATR